MLASGWRCVGHRDRGFGCGHIAAGVGGAGLIAQRRGRRFVGGGLCAVVVSDGRPQFKARLCGRGLDRGTGVGRLVGLRGWRRIRLWLGCRLRYDLLRDQQRMRKARGRHLAGGDDDPRAHLGPVPHLHGEGHRHADAAMRRRIAREHAGMHGDARPGDPLHVRHRRAAIDVGMVQLVFLDDAENAHRGRMTLHARGNRSFREEAVGVVDLQALFLDRDRDDQRSLRLGRFLLRRLDLLGLMTAGLLPPLRLRQSGPIISGIGIRPVIPRGFRLGSGTDRAGCRQSGNSPKLSGNRSPTARPRVSSSNP